MRIQEIEIKNIRGIPSFKIEPNYGNYIVFGPNGTGKSAIVDAIDFLLTGDIARLKGEGTAGIYLSEHGKHIDSEIENSYVRGTIKLNNIEEPIEIIRHLNSPQDLEYDSKFEKELEPILKRISNGGCILTRKELLKFIIAKSGDRAKEIQNLLDLNEIEEIRASLVRVNNKIKGIHKEKESILQNRKNEIVTFINEKHYAPETVLQYINEKRNILRAPSISELNPKIIQENIKTPIYDESITIIEKSTLEGYFEILTNINKSEILGRYQQILRILDELAKNPELFNLYSKIELTKLGLTYVDETGACPLCDTPFEPGELISLLSNKIKKAEEFKDNESLLKNNISDFKGILSRIQIAIEKIKNVANHFEIESYNPELIKWTTNLKNIEERLNDPINNYDRIKEFADSISLLVSPNNIDNLRELSKLLFEKIPDKSPEQEAWDLLTSIKIYLDGLENAEKEFAFSEKNYKESSTMLTAFLDARDETLSKLYDSVKHRFVTLYKEVHQNDENTFDAQIIPRNAALDFKVDFLNHGYYPPNALHSEGHQDSMGLCLFLALYEYLNKGKIDVIILDDVVMSIDREHRKSICKILVEEYPEQQIFITTHDRIWCKQLKSEGFADSQNILEFYNWDIYNGPYLHQYIEIWDEIKKLIDEGKTDIAAFKLRRNSEEFYTAVCENIGAKVPLKLDGQWDLGELNNAALGEYSSLLKMAKQAANSWNDKEKEEDLKKIEEYKKELFKSLNTERWTVNPNVHFNIWADFSPKELLGVSNVFKEIYSLFTCEKCSSIISIVKNNYNEITNLRCRCGDYDFNLIKK